MATAAKYPNAALADFAGEQPSQPANELILNADINATALSIVATANIPASWPQPGKMVIDGEVIKYTSYAAATFTIAGTGDRGLETAFGAGAAASHTAGAVIGNYVTALTIAQVVAELLAHQTGITTTGPNLVPNSDFSRRTTLGLAMPESFADTSAWTGGSLSAATNQLTQATTSVWSKWTGPNTMWKDGRWSVQFKFQSASFVMGKYIDANDALTTGNAVVLQQDAATFYLRKLVAGTFTNLATFAFAPTVANYYWFELETQGTGVVGRLYSSGASAVAKSSATLIQTLSGTVADAGLATGGIALWANTTNSVWGGIAASPGGCYVETWLPEPWTLTFTNLGGQAIGYDEVADAGPLGKQAAIRGYIPATSRVMTLQYISPSGAIGPSITYVGSFYSKVSSYGGSGAIMEATFYDFDAALGNPHAIMDYSENANNASWTRRTSTATVSASTGRRLVTNFTWNVSSTATGNCWVMCPQVEQGLGITVWKGNPADSLPVVYRRTDICSIVNTTTEYDLFRRSIKAGTLGKNGWMRLTVYGDTNSNSTNPTLNIRIKFGSTAIMATGAITTEASTARGVWKIDFIINNQGVTNAQRSVASFFMNRPAFETSPLMVMQLASTPVVFYGIGMATSTEDTTGDLELAITGQLGTATSVIDARITHSVLEVYPG